MEHLHGAADVLELMLASVMERVFDPQLHEAVQHEPAEGSGPTVTVLSTVLRRGYRISDRVLRPAMVTVQDRPEAPAGGGADAGDGEPQNPA